MDFSRQGYWSGLPFLSSGDLPDPGIEPGSPLLQADSLPSEPPPPVSSVVFDLALSLKKIQKKEQANPFKTQLGNEQHMRHSIRLLV